MASGCFARAPAHGIAAHSTHSAITRRRELSIFRSNRRCASDIVHVCSSRCEAAGLGGFARIHLVMPTVAMPPFAPRHRLSDDSHRLVILEGSTAA